MAKKKKYPFDFNNLTTPRETEKLRTAWNEFLLEKYGDVKALKRAWVKDPLFRWENPKKHTILIPSNFHGETEYKPDLTSRQANPRISDAREMIYEIQKEWATDLFNFLRDEVGLK
ncbi:MAG TPA: hypothetical protein EYP19_01070, partial [Desulfobacterales bacterium]|nr:hypothetical protein [Desulfobacterales bacterium]